MSKVHQKPEVAQKNTRERSLESKQESRLAHSKFLMQSKCTDVFNRSKASANCMFSQSYHL